MSSTRDLLEFRDTLPAEERSRLEARILYAHETLLQQAARIAKLPLLPPDAVKKREWVKKRTHGKADARGLTDAEIAGRATPLAPQTRLRESVSRYTTLPICNLPCYPPYLAAVPLPTYWDSSHLQRPRSFRRSGARSRASANARPERPTTRQGPQDCPH
jgi:hypothetical protein